jgi:hypothetical protein
VKFFKQPGNQPPVRVCAKCEGNQKDAPVLGLTIVKGMRHDSLKYEDRTILDPRNGKVYHAQMDLSPDGQKLSVRDISESRSSVRRRRGTDCPTMRFRLPRSPKSHSGRIHNRARIGETSVLLSA